MKYSMMAWMNGDARGSSTGNWSLLVKRLSDRHFTFHVYHQSLFNCKMLDSSTATNVASGYDFNDV